MCVYLNIRRISDPPIFIFSNRAFGSEKKFSDQNVYCKKSHSTIWYSIFENGHMMNLLTGIARRRYWHAPK